MTTITDVDLTGSGSSSFCPAAAMDGETDAEITAATTAAGSFSFCFSAAMATDGAMACSAITAAADDNSASGALSPALFISLLLNIRIFLFLPSFFQIFFFPAEFFITLDIYLIKCIPFHDSPDLPAHFTPSLCFETIYACFILFFRNICVHEFI